MPQDNFDERIASRYDATTVDMFDADVLGSTVDLLADLAGDGAALEFGIGTGRVAVPLSDRGVPVHGIDISEPMAARLREKPGADRIGVTIGDFATTRVEGEFRVVYLVFNTIMNLLDQDEQVACFTNAAAHLEPGGRFLVEVVVPDLRRLPPGETTRVFTHRPGYVGFDEYTDIAAQQSASHHWWLTDAGVETFTSPFRFVWPSELDLMARLAGMTRAERWGGWRREPFTSESTSHVSVWEKPG